jgi:hypothetical protein
MVVPKLPGDDVASAEGMYVTFGNGRLSVTQFLVLGSARMVSRCVLHLVVNLLGNYSYLAKLIFY